VLALLARHGVDLGAPCDGEGDDAHGTPARGLSARPRGRALRTMRSRCRMYKGFRAQVLRRIPWQGPRSRGISAVGRRPRRAVHALRRTAKFIFRAVWPRRGNRAINARGAPTAPPTHQAWQLSSRAPVTCATVQRQRVHVSSGWGRGTGASTSASLASAHCKHTHAAAASVAA